MTADDLAARYLAGVPVAELAADVGVDQSTIWRRLHAAGVPLRGRTDHGAGEILTRRWLEVRVRQGLSVADMAEEAGVHESTVREWLARRGLAPAGADPVDVEERGRRSARVAAAFAAGATRPEIAEAEGCSVRTVGRMLAAAGVRGRPGRRPGR